MTTAEVAIVMYAEDAAILRVAALELDREGKSDAATYDRWGADLLDRARRAEDTNPEPRGDVDPWCACEDCQSWLFAARWKRLT